MRQYLDKECINNLKFFVCLLFVLCSSHAFSQDAETVMLEPEFTVRISTETRWSYSFGLANRGILIEEIDAEDASENVTEHIELNHYTIYSIGENSDLSLGLRYRFREIFDPGNENLFRIIQQYFSESNSPFLSWWNRARFEQRFGPTITIFRLRYELGLSKPIGRGFALELSTEALYSMSRQFKPQPEQRIALGLINTSLENWDFNIGVEYRMDNYIRDQENNIFILTGALLKL